MGMRAQVSEDGIFLLGGHSEAWKLGCFGKGVDSRSLAESLDEPVLLMPEESAFMHDKYGLEFVDVV